MKMGIRQMVQQLGPHLHFSVRKDGELIDPLTVLEEKGGLFA